MLGPVSLHKGTGLLTNGQPFAWVGNKICKNFLELFAVSRNLPGQFVRPCKFLDASDVPIVQTGNDRFALGQRFQRRDAEPASHVVEDDMTAPFEIQTLGMREPLKDNLFYILILRPQFFYDLVEYIGVLVILPGRGLADLDRRLGQGVVVAGQVAGVVDGNQIGHPGGVFGNVQKVRSADDYLAFQSAVLLVICIDIQNIIRVAMVVVENFFPLNVVPNHQRSKVGVFIIRVVAQ